MICLDIKYVINILELDETNTNSENTVNPNTGAIPKPPGIAGLRSLIKNDGEEMSEFDDDTADQSPGSYTSSPQLTSRSSRLGTNSPQLGSRQSTRSLSRQASRNNLLAKLSVPFGGSGERLDKCKSSPGKRINII